MNTIEYTIDRSELDYRIPCTFLWSAAQGGIFFMDAHLNAERFTSLCGHCGDVSAIVTRDNKIILSGIEKCNAVVWPEGYIGK